MNDLSGVAGIVAIPHMGEVSTELLHWIRRLPSNVILATPRGNQIPRQRNMAVAEYGIPPWVLFVDSDSIPPLDALRRIVEHREPIVGAVVLERASPFRVTAVKSLEPPARYELAELPKTGLIEVVAVGTGFTLIRAEVFKTLEMPWFRCGQIISDLLLEDTELCLRAGRAGFPTHLDCGLRIGHVTEAVLWPGHDGKPWVQWRGPYEHRETLDMVVTVPPGVMHAGGY